MPNTLHAIADLDFGGAQTQLRLLVAARAERGEVATVASLRRPGPVAGELAAYGARVDWLGGRFAVDPFAIRRLAMLIDEGACEAVHSWDAASARHVLPALRWARRRPRWIHAVRDAADAARVGGRGLGRADALIASCDALVETVSGLTGAAAPRVVPNYCDPPMPNTKARGGVLEELGLPADARLIVAAGRFDDARLAKELVWAADLVRVVRPEARLVLVGDGPARRRVERFARDAAEPGLVYALGARGDWPRLLAAADVVWCASDAPGAPTALVEATAAGKPVVTNDAPGRERLVTTGETGWLTAWDDRAGWARPTDRLLGDAALARSIGAAAAERGRGGWDLAEMVAAYDHATEGRVAMAF